MSSDSSGFEVIDRSSVVITLDCGYLSHILLLNKEDTASLLWKASSLGAQFKTQNGIEFEVLDSGISFTYPVSSGNRVDIYPDKANLLRILSDAFDELLKV